MTKTKIFNLVIKKAKQKGYRTQWCDLEEALNSQYIIVFDIGNAFRGVSVINNKKIETNWFSIYSVIFSHDFAKSFFSETCYCCRGKPIEKYFKCPVCNLTGKYSAWEYHLQQMVIKEEPLKYLEQFLE